jgi:uncharacterized protein (DUF2132 family)
MTNNDETNNHPPASTSQANNPLHGITLENIVVALVDHYDWDGLYDRIKLNCFKTDPSVKSTLKFLRKTPWARTRVEEAYLQLQKSPWKNAKNGEQ